MGDVVAVILRVITKYSPVLILRNHSGVIRVDKETLPLATLTNAAEWYTNYVIILSALTFGLDRAADSTYDAIDMLFETLFFVPVLCMLNGFTIVMLYNQWNTVKKRQELKLRRGSGHLPTITELFSIYIDPEVDSTAPKSLSRLKDLQEKRMLHRLEMELSFAMIAIIDQQIDFFAVLFYTLYWASYSRCPSHPSSALVSQIISM
ncbi:hypothetical protein RB195_000364 [Necator americanus]|uniref:Ion transport domain-containing protein n=1 Tax=Necator americanus TaxID=51031 RepID=A0ABR1D9B0_NECAM